MDADPIKGIIILVALLALYDQFMPEIRAYSQNKIMKELEYPNRYTAQQATKEQVKEWNMKKAFSSVKKFNNKNES